MLRAWADTPADERPAVGWAGACFFLVLCGYSVLRPLRDEMGIAGGVEHLPWVFTATFVGTLLAIPLFAHVVSRHRARLVVPLAYHAVAASLLAFAALLALEVRPEWVARAFFVWISVANLFLVSIFWSLMADAFTSDQGARLFGFIAAGGSAGAIAGPLLARQLAGAGSVSLLVAGALLLEGGILCVSRLMRWSASAGRGSLSHEEERPIGGSVLSGLTLLVRSPYLLLTAGLVVLFTSTSTFVYFEQARIVRDAFASSVERTRFFASIDLAVNILAVVLQVTVASRLLTRLGVGAGLALLPLVTAAGFALLAISPTLAMLAGFQTLRRALHHALDRPAREILFTLAGREEKYKSKSVIDTVLYRGGDAVSGWAHAGLVALGLAGPAIALAALPLCAAWLVAALHLGKRHRELQRAPAEEPKPCPSPVAT